MLRGRMRRAVLVRGFYLLCFAALTNPLLSQFSTHLFGDGWDGFQSAWGVWWIDYAVTRLHQWPWHTTHLHSPTASRC
jgi:hypothetical protein